MKTTAFVLPRSARRTKRPWCCGRRQSPRNFTLQTEPQIRKVVRIKEFGQDFFLR